MGGSVLAKGQQGQQGGGGGSGMFGASQQNPYGGGLMGLGRMFQARNVPNAQLPAPPAGNTPIGQAPQRGQGVYQPPGQPMGQPTNMPQYVPGSAMQGGMNPFASALQRVGMGGVPGNSGFPNPYGQIPQGAGFGFGGAGVAPGLGNSVPMSGPSTGGELKGPPSALPAGNPGFPGPGMQGGMGGMGGAQLPPGMQQSQGINPQQLQQMLYGLPAAFMYNGGIAQDNE